MRVTLLGTGAALPAGDRYQASVLVEGEDREPLLVDCGAGTLHRLVQAGCAVSDVETILLTHHHLDHVADLPSLLKARWLDGSPTARIVGPPGTKAYLTEFLAIDEIPERVDLRIDEREGTTFDLAGYSIQTAQTTHSQAGFAYRIDDALTISGDTEATDAIAALAEGSSVLVQDCAFHDDRESHGTPVGIARAYADLDVDRIYLTHLYPETAARAASIRSEIDGAVDATVHVGSDLETVTIG
ncbi:MBL fold metallo-hydrolase [Halococcoides cellulosivorans]|uniref:MBL fold metallo-hydrolase n=1 Tax=Halococcoides cellulosivorans TaxID=1679096 RepID=A0A2R4X1J6_9EURY|nr:MBL fold metallo-hydrolase [Halococcoides cellulosivorans]AWB27655.1 MBL fold metallo-hydrolase [Halococcoides cellulosivorans]